jgi:hypothetical protein
MMKPALALNLASHESLPRLSQTPITAGVVSDVSKLQAFEEDNRRFS